MNQTIIQELEQLKELAEQPVFWIPSGGNPTRIDAALRFLTPSRISALIDAVKSLGAMIPMAKCYQASLNLSLSAGNAAKEIVNAEFAIAKLNSQTP